MDTRFHGYDKGRKKWIPLFTSGTKAERNGYHFPLVPVFTEEDEEIVVITVYSYFF